MTVNLVLLGSTIFGIFSAFWWNSRKNNVGPNNLIIITGCDSGLGYSIAVHCHNKLGMFVIACVLNQHSDGAKQLLELDKSINRLMILELDLTNTDSIIRASEVCKEYLQLHKNLKLTAIVNNAGIMCFGEFEWQTENMIQKQIGTNLIGTMNFTKKNLPLVRQYKSRIINVTSHCGLQALPGLSVYAVTKAGLRFWTDALRMELKPYGVKVVEFIPGKLIMDTNITEKQMEYAVEMLAGFDSEQRKFYEEYCQRYNNYLKVISFRKPIKVINDKKVITTFENSLLHTRPKTTYKYEPLRYTIYHGLFRITPASIRDYLVIKFMSMPKYKI